ncbi:MAG TPA: protein translocase subunit SecD [Amnibacterium sp.]|nr:protein translocase subunit SecD [Amnibacterium sp.]
MARAVTPHGKARRSLVGLVVIVLALVALNLLGVLFAPGSTFGTKMQSFVPKLGLDLEGGTQIILSAQTTNGKPPTADQLNQSVAIIRQRVDAGGVSEAQISTAGGQNIIVSLPGSPSQATINSVKSSARMVFRSVLLTTAATTSSVGKNAPAYTPPASLSNQPSTKPTNGSDLAYVTPYLKNLYDNYNCAQDTTAAQQSLKHPADPLVTCDPTGTVKYLLGPVEVQGTHIANATSGVQTTSQGATTGQWVVNLAFDGTGAKEFSAVSSRLVALAPPQNEFAIELDGKVIEAPAVNQAITNGQAQISGSFTQNSSKALADQLKFGALPISFTVQSQDTISATLGSTQLLSGLIAGLIGLVLVVGYSLLQYRTLSFVTVGSLLVSATLTYLVIDFLSWREGYRLSLAGVAGLIVSIGITADSFIVYFERIRDELREGKALVGAVEAGWRRAIRTVLASDGVNLLAAAVLYILAVGDVRGFALTLGLTTLIDVVTVSLFTHPVLQLIARRPFFAEGHRFSGLDPRALGAVYRGRGSFRVPAVATGAALRSRGEAARRQTIAERKAAEQGLPTRTGTIDGIQEDGD